MKQSSLGLSNTTKRTGKRESLDAMELVLPWAELASLIEPYAPKDRTPGPAVRRTRCASTKALPQQIRRNETATGALEGPP